MVERVDDGVVHISNFLEVVSNQFGKREQKQREKTAQVLVEALRQTGKGDTTIPYKDGGRIALSFSGAMGSVNRVIVNAKLIGCQGDKGKRGKLFKKAWDRLSQQYTDGKIRMNS